MPLIEYGKDCCPVGITATINEAGIDDSLGKMIDHQRRPLPIDPEAERKFNSWRATTIAMFLDSLDQKKVDLELKRRTNEYVRRIFNTLRDLVKRDEEKGCRDQITAIINQAHALYMEIS